MRDIVRNVSEEDTEFLANKYDLNVSDDEMESLTKKVNARLNDSLDDIYSIPVMETTEETGNRSWKEPSDPYNAISIDCHVPPNSDHSGLLDSMSFGIKDNISVANVPMQCSSGVLHGFIPSGDAEVINRLRAAGSTISAKTNLDEFAGGARGKSFRGLILNPHDSNRIAGGSSGGSGAAVAGELVDAALGTDTGGSVRYPAAFCGLVGVKPTYGLVPLTGVIENTYTLDHVGSITQDVEDAARVLEAIAGKDQCDPASMIAAAEDTYQVGGYVNAIQSPPAAADIRIGIVRQGIEDDIDDIVASRHEKALNKLENAGITFEVVEIPHLDIAKHIKYVISYVELMSYWRDKGTTIRRGGMINSFDQVSFARRAHASNHELNNFYRARLLTGAQLLEAHDGRHYTRAHAARNIVREELVAELNKFDAIVTPTVPYLAPEVQDVEDSSLDPDALDDEKSFSLGRYTKIANITGVPAITVPNEIEPGPAVGLQFMANHFEESTLFGIAERVIQILED